MTDHPARETVYFVAGEASGDNHGVSLMNALRRLDPALRFSGRGGPQMQTIAGGSFRNWIDRAAVVGLWEVIKNYSFFRREFRQTLNEIEAQRPACVVLIDYPGFNLRLSRALSQKTNRPRIIYYISPQVWAWNRGRIRHMARWLDLMLCIFPFEAQLYNKSGLRTVFVGHPMHERLESQRTASTRDRNLVALFPGSRQREVRKILPVMIETTKLLRKQNSALRFEIVAASPELESLVKSQLQALPNEQSEALQVTSGRAAAAMQEAWVGVVASGSATLEAAWFRLPFVLVYKVSWLTYLAGRLVIKVKHLGMPNVIAGRSVVPEFIQHGAKPKHIATGVLRLMADSPARAQMLADFDQIVGSLGAGGASDRAAGAIINELNSLGQLAQPVRSTV
jgi:lipid-A-disaccharide synthase